MHIPTDEAGSIIATKMSDAHVPLERHCFHPIDLPICCISH
eukprot:COSAG02_NODE_46770_length_346_cov_0.834008_1_plen_40_part_10